MITSWRSTVKSGPKTQVDLYIYVQAFSRTIIINTSSCKAPTLRASAVRRNILPPRGARYAPPIYIVGIPVAARLRS